MAKEKHPRDGGWSTSWATLRRSFLFSKSICDLEFVDLTLAYKELSNKYFPSVTTSSSKILSKSCNDIHFSKWADLFAGQNFRPVKDFASHSSHVRENSDNGLMNDLHAAFSTSREWTHHANQRLKQNHIRFSVTKCPIRRILGTCPTNLLHMKYQKHGSLSWKWHHA